MAMKKNEIAVMESFALTTQFDGMDEELKAQMEEELDDLDEGSGIDCLKITVPPRSSGSSFVVQVDGDEVENMKEFDAVILFTHKLNSRWDGAYDGNNNPPVCSAIDAKTGIMYETGEARSCDQCPYNDFTRNEDGTVSGKECKNMRRIYLMMNGDSHLYLLSVPPASMKEVGKQIKKASSEARVPISQLVFTFSLTKMTAKSTKRDFNQVTLKATGKLNAEQGALTKAMREEILRQYKGVAITRDDYAEVSDGTATSSAAPKTDGDGFMEVPEDGAELPFN